MKYKYAELKRMQDAFHKTPYRGEYPRQFKNYLSQCARRFSAKPEAEDKFAIRKGYFGKFVSITQTSGCGKSRLLLEVCRICVSSLQRVAHPIFAAVKNGFIRVVHQPSRAKRKRRHVSP